MSTEELYGSLISQPARAVLWLCKLHDHAMKLNYIDVGKGESKTEAFLQLSPIGKIPVLKDGDFVLTESHAIMTYLAEKHGWHQWYPQDLKTRARIHEYMNWHHTNVRRCTEIFINQLWSNMGRGEPFAETAKNKQQVIDAMLRILEFWLRSDSQQFICSTAHPTLADLSCYNELVQLEVMGLVPNVATEFPQVSAWLQRMKLVPHHEAMLTHMLKFCRKFQLLPSKL